MRTKSILIFDEYNYIDGFTGPYQMDVIPFEHLSSILDPIIEYLECVDEMEDDYVDEL